MGLITELRNRSWIVLIFIALALVSFLLMDAFNSNRGILSNKREAYASIDGREISPAEYDAKYQDMLLQYLTQTRQYTNAKYGQFQLDNQTEFQLREQAWNDMLNETLINEQIEKIGITITQDELNNLIYGANPHPYIKNYYSALSEDGIFDPAKLVQYYNTISNQQIWEQNPQAEEEYYNFVMREKLAKKDYIQTKYTSLFSKADYVPSWMAKRDYEVKNRRATFDYVDIPYATIADSTITVSEKELKTYFEKNKNKFKQKDATVIIDYVMWNFVPTSADSAAILASLNDDIIKMQSAKSDSTYIANHSEDPAKVSNAFMSRADLYTAGSDSSIVDSIFTKPVGSLIGPYKNAGYYKATSIRNRKIMPDSVDVKHILIAAAASQNADSSKLLADSILTALNGGADFAQLAVKYSADNGSSQAGGELGWITPATNFPKEFNDYVFETGKVGENMIVKTQFGFHIVNIKEQKNKKEYVQIYQLSKFIEASNKTVDSVNSIASEFYETHQTEDLFENGAVELNLPKRTSPPLTKNQQEIPGIEDTRSIITWGFTSKKGAFNIFNSLSDKVIVAYLKEVRPQGIPKLEDVKDQVEAETIREKKGTMLTQKMNDALAGASDLAAIAQKVGSSVKNSPNATLGAPYAAGLGNEPSVVGVVMASEQGMQSKVIVGLRGVYITKVSAITEPTETQDYSLNQNQLTYSLRTKLGPQNVLTNLINKADVVDNRFKY